MIDYPREKKREEGQKWKEQDGWKLETTGSKE